MLNKVLAVIAFAWVLLVVSGCSVFMAIQQPSKKDINLFSAGTPRDMLVAEFGLPAASEIKDGKRHEMFIFTQGYSTATKAGRAVFHSVADVFTLGLWEAVGTPTELVFHGKELRFDVTYDKNDRVDKVIVLKTTHTSGISNEVTADSYARTRDESSVVILSVNWGRKWGCGAFENAQLMSIAFDRLDPQKTGNNRPPDLFLNSPGRLMVYPVYLPYALLVEPGEYALSAFNIKAARSASDMGKFEAYRGQLIKDGQPLGGSFEVGVGETIYIGHFFLSCHADPTLWRYYWGGPNPFDKYLGQIKAKYPFLDLTKVQVRLFRTTVFGNDEYNDAGLQAERDGDFASAERNFELALSRAQSNRSPDESLISMVTYNLGRIKGYLCKSKDAEQLLLEALRLKEKAEEKASVKSDIMDMRLNELGRFYYDRGQFGRAVHFYSRGIPLAKTLGVESTDPITFADMIEEYSKALENVGRPEDAKAAKQEAEDLRAKNPERKGASFRRYDQSC